MGVAACENDSASLAFELCGYADSINTSEYNQDFFYEIHLYVMTN